MPFPFSGHLAAHLSPNKPDTNALAFKAIDQAGFSTEQLCHFFDVGPSQISRWRRGRDRFPRLHIQMLRKQAFVASFELELADRLFFVNEARQKLYGTLGLSGFRKNSATKKFVNEVESLLIDNFLSRPHLNLEHEVEHLFDLYVSAIRVCSLLFFHKRGDDYKGIEFITQENILRHLRYPTGVVTEKIIKAWQQGRFPEAFSDSFRLAIKNVIDTAEMRPRDLIENRMVEEAIHVGARLAIARPLELKRMVSGDQFVQRASAISSLFSNQQPDLAPAVQAVLDDKPIGRAIVDFDRIHFGDGGIKKDGSYYVSETPMDRSILYAIAGAMDPGRPSGWPLRRVQLLKLLEKVGSAQGLEPGTRRLLRAARTELRLSDVTSNVDRLLRTMLEAPALGLAENEN